MDYLGVNIVRVTSTPGQEVGYSDLLIVIPSKKWILGIAKSYYSQRGLAQADLRSGDLLSGKQAKMNKGETQRIF